MQNINTWTQKQMDKIGMRVVVQAVKDFALPERMDYVKARLSRLDKSDPMYKEVFDSLCINARKKIIKELRGSFVIALSDGKSEEVAKKLENILSDKTQVSMNALRRNVKHTDLEEED